jgi:hypothetical protein
MKKKEWIEDGKIVLKDRIGIDYKPTHGFSAGQCDLCDEVKYPMVSWCCEHDDPAHGTSVCFDCLRKIIELEK